MCVNVQRVIMCQSNPINAKWMKCKVNTGIMWINGNQHHSPYNNKIPVYLQSPAMLMCAIYKHYLAIYVDDRL